MSYGHGFATFKRLLRLECGLEAYPQAANAIAVLTWLDKLFFVVFIPTHSTHLHVVLLAFQYLVILPVVVRCLRSHQDTSAAAHIRIPKLNTIALLFALMAVPLSWLSTPDV